jgi:hypothetical protein
MARRSEATGTVPCAIAFAFMAGAIAIAVNFSNQRHIPIDWSFSFFETFMRDMPWPWAAGGCAVSILGCIAGEKARNRGAGFIGTVAVTGCLLLALAYAMVLFYAVGGYARLLDFMR